MSQPDETPAPFFDSLVDDTGFDTLLTALPGANSPFIGWTLLWIGVAVVFQIYKISMGYANTYIQNPTTIIGQLLVLLAGLGTVYLHNRYATALQQADIDSRTSDPDRFRTLLSTKWMGLIYLLAVVYTFVTFFLLKGVATLMQIGGLAEVIFAAVVAPVGYATITAEFVGVYVGIMFVLPRRIKTGDFKLHFLDPEGLGGLRPIGELMKTTYYFIVVGLVGWLVIVYGPFVLGQFVESPLSPPGFVINAAFTSAWLLSIATMAYGLSQLHIYMKRAKRAELMSLDRQARELIERPFDLQKYEIEDEERYDDLRDRMAHVNGTKEYPTTFTMWSQILISLILPKAIQMVLASV